MAFLLDNPNRLKQYGYPRRGGGYTAPQITIHTYEAPHTRSLLAAATYLIQRTNHGSYHALAGAKGPRDVLQLAPWSYETWHSTPNNNWAVGISAVAYAHQWNTIPRAARDNLVKSMAYAASQAAKWLQDTHGRKVEPRWLTRAQAMRKESGFVMHSTMDPGRRSDAGANFPRAEFIAEFNRLMAGGTPAVTPPPAPTPAPAPGPGGYTGASLVDYLNHAGQDSSLAARRALAAQHGITPYTGTAEQNTRLLSALRSGATPGAANAVPTPTVEREWSEVATKQEIQDAVREVVRQELAAHRAEKNVTWRQSNGTTSAFTQDQALGWLSEHWRRFNDARAEG